MDSVRAAVVQASPVHNNHRASMAKIRNLLSDTSQSGAKLAVFPEAFLGGYPRGATFGTSIGSRTPEGREEFRHYWNAAIDVPGPVVFELGELAAEFRTHLVIGVIERDGGTLYCTVLFYDATGAYLGKHRKLMPTGAERLIWGFGDGSTLNVFDTEIGRLGAVVCWENYMPLLRAAMYSKGIQIYCAPTADSRDTWTATMRHVACEGRCFVLGANQYITLDDDCADVKTSDQSALMSRGGSLIVSPMGEILAGPCFDQEAVLTADLDLAEIVRGKYDFDVVGHYARPDIFRLTVNERVQRAVFTETD
ncbi:nitrilase-related carbon-nitrogen hydrolase [Nonomuraea sp. NPDC048901]|uniref:nitrilase-related carbon-nitrogen hydrolase n=1 Tax=Nonomuraea sp. NPDC048901 TaxID=3155627 RepID=UPI0033EA6F02